MDNLLPFGEEVNPQPKKRLRRRRGREEMVTDNTTGWQRRQEQGKDLREEKLRQGICLHCPNPAVTDAGLCADCLEVNRRRTRRVKDRRKCNDCGNAPEPGRAFCLVCRNQRFEKTAAARKERRDKGLCLLCGKVPPQPGRKQCSVCNAAGRERTRLHRQSRIAAGLCGLCGKAPFLESQTVCEPCFFKRTSQHHFGTPSFAVALRDMFYRASGRCAYSGLPLVLGKDAVLDHITPLARGGEIGDICNVHWVHDMVNQMKKNYLEGEFFQMVAAIYTHRIQDKGH